MAVKGLYSVKPKEAAALRGLVIESVPKQFWSDYYAIARTTYLTAFKGVYDNHSILDELKPSLLPQQRHCQMETVLFQVAQDHGLAASATLIQANHYPYVFVGGAAVCFVQHYVPAVGDLPKPAAFREQLAAMNQVTLAPMFDFAGEPDELMQPKQVHGIITHNPVGKKFTEQHQSLQEIRFGIPSPDMKDWVDEPSIAELMAGYPAASNGAGSVEPQWRTDPKRKEEK